MAAYLNSSAFQHRAAAAGLTAPLLRTVIERFYARIRRDAVLGTIFEDAIGENWDAHIEKIYLFWLTATRLGSGYKGSDFLPAHMKLGAMKSELLPLWLSLFRQTVDELCTPEAASALLDIAERMAEMLDQTLKRRESAAAR